MTFPGSIPIKMAILLMLSVGTILFFNLYDRYLVIGPELIMNNLFHNNLAQWEYSVQGVSILSPDVNTVRLNSENPANDIYLSQTIPDVARYSLLRLECDIKTRDIPQVQGSWDSVRIALISHDPSGVPMYKLPHALVNLHGTHDWQHHEGVFLVSNNTVMVRLSVQLAQATGTLWVKNFSLRPLVERTSYRTFRSVVTLLWATAALWILVPIAQSAYRDTHRIVLIAVALAILCGALMPERQKEHIGNFLFPSLVKPAISPHAPAVFNFSPLLPTLDIYKAGHFVLFFTLAAAAFYRRPYPVTRAQMLVYLLLFALVTEILQLLVSGRTAQLGDVIIDGAGIATGFMLLRVMQTTQE